MEVSIIIPAYNEESNIPILFSRLKKAFETFGNYEIIFINDGSTDGTFKAMKAISDRRVRVLHFPENRGQSVALFEGFKQARGRLIVTMDADLQNDPEDIVKLVSKINEGFEAVFGVRVNRKDSFMRTLQATLANGFADIFLGEKFKDRGCALKCFKRSILVNIPFFNGVHRFFPTLLRKYRTAEIPVQHYPRIQGKSKYGGIRRALKALKDTFYVKKLIREGKI